MNPYLKKIGVDSAEPSHFELLHIRSDEIDKDVIKAAAKKVLLRLGADPEDESQGDWKTVRRQIKQAYQCLIDDQQRTAYIASLPRQDESHDDFSVTLAGEDSDDQDTESSLDTVTEELREEMLQEAARPPQPPPQPTGLALPMAEVVSDATGHAAEPLPMAKAPPPEPSGVSVNVNSGNSSPRRNGGLGRWLPVLLLAALIVTAVAWGGFLWLQGQDDRGGDQGPGDSQPTPGQPDKDVSPVSGSGEQETGAAKGDDVQDRTSEKQSTRQGGSGLIDQELENLANKPVLDQRPSLGKLDPGRNWQPVDSESGTETSESPDIETAVMEDPFDRPPVDTSWARRGNPTREEKLEFAHHMHQAYLAMRRHHWDRMNAHFDAVKHLTLSSGLESWRRQRVVAEDYQQFWDTVGELARQLPSLTELEVDDERISVTEAQDEMLILRIRGQRVPLRYNEIPARIALAIYAHSHSVDSPGFQVAECLVYAVAARHNPDYANQVVALSARAAKHTDRVSDYRGMSLDYLDKMFGSTSWPSVPDRQFQIEQDNLRAEYPEMKREIRSSREDSWNRAIALRDLSLRETGRLRACILLQEALPDCVKSGDPLLLDECLNLYEKRFTGNTREFLQYYEQMEQQGELDEESARVLVKLYLERSNGLLNVAEQYTASQDELENLQSGRFRRAADDCVIRARELAGKHGLADWVERIDWQSGSDTNRQTGRLGM